MAFSILVVEDNPGDVLLIRRAFGLLNVAHEVTVARDGAEALRLIAEAAGGERHIDLLLLDLNLPRHNGAEILTAVRREEGLQRIPVILLTSSDSPLDYELGRRLGANLYFRKPSDLAEFMKLGPLALELLKGSSNLQDGGESFSRAV